MIILSHRGLWLGPEDKNSLAAFNRSAAAGFGTELDVRDAARELVIAHDPPAGGELAFADAIRPFAAHGLIVAVNVKADGLAAQVGETMAALGTPWFAFDMSGPETIRYLRLGLPVFTRHSDIEPEPICYAQAQGVWLDAFESDWYDPAVIARHRAAGKSVCIVSPELHGREPGRIWTELAATFRDDNGVLLCTDRPHEAQRLAEARA